MLGKLVAVAALAAGGVMLKKQLAKTQGGRDGGSTSSIEETIEVNVPLSTAYNQWTQFEEFPKFMHGVEEVRQLDDTHLHWRARIAGKEEHWHSEITSQVPDKRIAWRSTSGPSNSGVVSFERITDDRTRITFRMEYVPPGWLEKIGDALGLVKSEASGNLSRFAEFIEKRHRETGAWRGTVSAGTAVGGGSGSGGATGSSSAGSSTGSGTPTGSSSN